MTAGPLRAPFFFLFPLPARALHKKPEYLCRTLILHKFTPASFLR